MANGSALATPYPSAEEWRALVRRFSPEAIAHKLLLASTPFVFRDEPLKFALFRRTVGDAFNVEPTNVFIVGSAMAGRSLKGRDIEQGYSAESDIDTLIVSEPLFTTCVMDSLDWVRQITKPDEDTPRESPTINPEVTKHIGWLALHACRGIWRPDSLPPEAAARQDFFAKFAKVGLATLGLQLSDDTVAKVTGRVARSFEDAVKDLANNIRRLKKEFDDIEGKSAGRPERRSPTSSGLNGPALDGK